jgi:hypothetical protein
MLWSPADDGIVLMQCGQLEAGRSLVQQAADPHRLLNLGKKA